MTLKENVMNGSMSIRKVRRIATEMRQQGTRNGQGHALLTELQTPEYMPMKALLTAFFPEEKITDKEYRGLVQLARGHAVKKAKREDVWSVDYRGNQVKFVKWVGCNLYPIYWAAEKLPGQLSLIRFKFAKKEADREARKNRKELRRAAKAGRKAVKAGRKSATKP